MVSTYKIENTKVTPDGDLISVELRGLSTDTKPTTVDNKIIDNGSVFIEIDTGSVFMFDYTKQEWNEV